MCRLWDICSHFVLDKNQHDMVKAVERSTRCSLKICLFFFFFYLGLAFFLLCCFSFQDSTSMKSVLLGPALVSERNVPTETLCLYLCITARSVKVKNGINAGLLGKVK